MNARRSAAGSIALDWLPTIALMVVVGLGAPYLGSVARPVFIIGCFIIGWRAWAHSPELHLQAAIALFSFAPLLRRIVDYHVGFDPGGMMIAGPLVAIVAPAVELRRLALPGISVGKELLPFFVFAGCVAYCVALTLAQGEWSQAVTGALKWGAPAIYGLALYSRRPNVPQLLRKSAATFAVILPIIGVYGLYQYVDPPLWDRYWLALAAITSAGFGEPYSVRTFSTMHSPASFATFTVVGLTLVFFVGKPTLTSRILLLPSGLALLLSLYRTAWLALLAGVLFCLLFPVTRPRAVGALLLVAVAVLVAATLTPFGEVIVERVATLLNASQDSSGEERMLQYWTLWHQPDSGLIGGGFSAGDTAVAGTLPVDGMIVACWSAMGIVAGIICLASVASVIASDIDAALSAKSTEVILLGAIACGWLVQLPLATITSGELGFLFWSLATLSLCMRQRAVTA